MYGVLELELLDDEVTSPPPVELNDGVELLDFELYVYGVLIELELLEDEVTSPPPVEL